MLSQNVTIDAALIGAVALIVGSVLGGFVATFFVHVTTSKAEKRKVLRQKNEEIYLLTNQMEEYSTSRAFDQGTLPRAKYTEKYLTSGNNAFVEDNIVEKMKMIASLYVPEIVKNIGEYQQEINRANRRIEQELDPKGRNAHTLANDYTYASTAINVHDDIANVNIKLRTVLLKVIPRY